jgi:putative ABC transport system permease protein
MLSDLRYAVRALLRAPMFTVTTVATLALAIGANVTVVSAVNTVLFRPLDIPDIGRLVVVRSDLPRLGLRNLGLTVRESVDLFARTDLFSTAGASYSTVATLTGAGPARQLRGATIIGAYFDVLGIRPALGRVPRAEDAQAGHAPVVVLSDGLWHELAGGDSGVVGRTIELDGAPREVIGVLRPGAELPRLARFWETRPIDAEALADPGATETVIAHPRPQVSPSQLTQALAVEAARWVERDPEHYPPEYRGILSTVPFVEDLAGTLRPIVVLFFAAVTLVLLIACVNVAGVQLVRSIGAANAIAIRSALGASRWRLLRHAVVESLVLATGGGAVGLILGQMGIAGLRTWHLTDYPALADVRLDVTVLAYTLGLTAIIGLAVALLPGLKTSRVVSRTTTLGRDRQGVLRGIAVLQVALTLMLLLGSGLMIRSVGAMLQVDPGFSTEHLYTARVALTGPRYAASAAKVAFFDGLVSRLRGMPGVTAAGAAIGIPFAQSDGASSGFTIVGLPPTGGTSPHSLIVPVTPGYFGTMGIAIKAGRAFTDADRLGAPRVAIVDEALAAKFLPGIDPIGRQITGQEGPTTIVGVVASAGYSRLWRQPYPIAYYPYAQIVVPGLTVVVRTASEMRNPAVLFESAVGGLDRDVPVSHLLSMRQQIDASVESRQVTMLALSAFAVASLALAILGLYGVVSYGTTVRTHEFGIRMALGATTSELLALVMRGGAALVLTGLAVGFVLFLAASRLLASFLYGVGTYDPITLAACAIVLGASAALACWLPARRVASVDPMIALRDPF